MSSKSRAEKERERQVQDKVQAILGAMLKDEDNKYCVDCDAKGPRWASWNLGVFLCIRCAGIHRNLGVHISRVKSVNLDSWTPQQVASMTVMGNSKGRAVYEASLPSDYRRPTSDQAMEAFIRQKYEKKKYIAAEWTNPKPPDFPAKWDTAGTAAQEPVKKPEFKKLNIASSKPSVSPQAPAKATAAATASPKPQPQAIKPVAAKPSVGLVKSSSTLDTDLLGLSLGSASSTPSGPSVPSSASSNDLLGLNSEFGDFVSTSPNPASVPASETSPVHESSAQAVADGKMSNSSILALFGPKSTPAPTAAPAPAQAQNFNSSSMFGSLPTQQPPQQQFGGLGGLQMTSFGAAPQQQQQQFGGFPQQVAQTQQQQFGQFQAINPPRQQNFGAGLISQPPAFNAAPSSQQNNMFDMLSSKPGQINNNQTPANNPFLETNQMNGLGNLGTVPAPSLWQ